MSRADRAYRVIAADERARARCYALALSRRFGSAVLGATKLPGLLRMLRGSRPTALLHRIVSD
jgi:hypothetical protein